MGKWTRVKDKRTGHEYSVVNVNEEIHEVLDKKAERTGGKPLPAKPRAKVAAAKSSGGEGEDLNALTVQNLQARAKKAGVEGYSTMAKDDLVKAVKEGESR